MADFFGCPALANGDHYGKTIGASHYFGKYKSDSYFGIIVDDFGNYQCCDEFEQQTDILETCGAGNTPDGVQPEKIFYDYVMRTYLTFLNGSDDFDSIDQELKSSFDRKNEATIRELDKLKKDQKALEEEYALLSQGETPLEVAQRENGILISDRDKFRAYIAHVESKQQKLEETLLSLKQELESQGLLYICC